MGRASLLVDVTRGFEYIVQGQDGSVEFGHVLFDDEMLPPCIQNVGLERRAWRTIVVQSGNTCRTERESKIVSEKADALYVRPTRLRRSQRQERRRIACSTDYRTGSCRTRGETC